MKYLIKFLVDTYLPCPFMIISERTEMKFSRTEFGLFVEGKHRNITALSIIDSEGDGIVRSYLLK